MVEAIVLILLASVGVFCGFMVGLCKNHITAVLAFMLTFLCVGFGFVAAQESLVGIVHVLVYSGAMAVVFLFVTFLVPSTGLVRATGWYVIIGAVVLCMALLSRDMGPVVVGLPQSVKNTVFIELYEYPYFAVVLGLVFAVVIVSLGFVFVKARHSPVIQNTYILNVKKWSKGA